MSECAPTERADVLVPALPPETAAVPSDVAPSKNSTVPVADAGATVAFRATL